MGLDNDIRDFDTADGYGAGSVVVLRSRVAGAEFDSYQLLADNTVLTGNGSVPPVAGGGGGFDVDADYTTTGAWVFEGTVAVEEGTFSTSDVSGLDTQLLAKADDNAVVKLTGNQTIAGVKTFSSVPVIPFTPTGSIASTTVAAAIAEVASEAASVSSTALSPFGNGADGAATISSNTTLTSDKYYTDLTIDATFTLTTAGYRVFVSGTLTNNGTIDNSGAAASGASAGIGALGGSLGAGLAGGAGSTTNGAAGGAASPSLGGAGGAGGAGSGGTAGAAGAVTAPTAATGGVGVWNEFRAAMMGTAAGTDTDLRIIPGSGGGGGGGDITNSGGGGGGSGGAVVIGARFVAGSGTISANGGAGASRATGTVGGGGGGGGGTIAFITAATSHAMTLSVAGGALGTGTNANGVVGSAGRTYVHLGVTSGTATDITGLLTNTLGGKDVVHTAAGISGAVTLDLSLGNVFVRTLSGNVTSVAVTNATSGRGCAFEIHWIQDSTPRTVAYGAAHKWDAGTAHVMSTGSGARDIVVGETLDGGTTMFSNVVGQAYA